MRRRSPWIGLACVLALSQAATAYAHATLVKAEPARRATLSHTPAQIKLWFNERLEPAYSSITVLRDGSGRLATRDALVDKTNPKLLVLDLPELAPGVYTVKYRVLSVDGHTIDNGYTFTVKVAPDASAAPD